jgi:transposase
MTTVTESETRAYFKIRVLLSATATDIHKDLVAACGNQASLYRTVAKWTQRFREGRETTEDYPRSGRPSTAIDVKNIAAVRILIGEDNRLTIYE